MNNMASVIVPKSDQINADDLMAGPITITITDVKVKPGQEQPVSIYFDGSDKAYRPCKSMARVLVSAWGPDAAKYKGRSLTLYCDPKVRWGGMEVGGIRISHMSHLESAMTMALTVTRANKKPFTVRPLVPSESKAATTQETGSASSGAPPSPVGTLASSAATPSDDDIIKAITGATTAQALTEAADLARSITDPKNKERASAAYKDTLAKLRGDRQAA